jgi:hypothetical protein
MIKCYICGVSKDLRPYGEGGKPICFPCMKATPEREREAEKMFESLIKSLEARGGDIITPKSAPRIVSMEEAVLLEDALGRAEKIR